MVNAGNIDVRIKVNDSELNKSLGGAKKSISNFAKFAIGAFAGIRIAGFFKNATLEAVKFENSMKGLATVASAFAVDADHAKDSAQALANDGLLKVGDAAEALKNLLASGFSMPEAIKLMEGFKDAAAFNRQGTLSFGDAIVGATQGIKNQNSIMVDNVGITKNLSVIMKEAGFTMQDLSDETKSIAARQALYNGLLKEASIFQGDTEKAADSAGGAFSRFNVTIDTLKRNMAEQFLPTLTDLTNFLTDNQALMDNVAISLTAIGSAIAKIIESIVTDLSFGVELVRELKKEFKDFSIKDSAFGGMEKSVAGRFGIAAGSARETVSNSIQEQRILSLKEEIANKEKALLDRREDNINKEADILSNSSSSSVIEHYSGGKLVTAPLTTEQRRARLISKA